MRRRNEQTRTMILTAAGSLFLSRGYTATTIDDVAAHAKVTKRTIYGYFADKRALLKGMVEQYVGDPYEFRIPLESIGTLEGLHNALYAVGQALNDIITQPRYLQLLRLAITELPSQPDLDVLLKEGITRRSLQTTAGILRTADMHGLLAVKNSELLATQFVGGFVVNVFLDGLLQAEFTAVHKLSRSELQDYVAAFMQRSGANEK